jgi:polyisoprenoid-binding protein YceI
MTKILLALALAIPALAAEQTVQLTPENTKIEWTLTGPLHTVHGTFKLRHGAITFDTATGKASGEVVVDVKSVGKAAATGATAACTKMFSNPRSTRKRRLLPIGSRERSLRKVSLR